MLLDLFCNYSQIIGNIFFWNLGACMLHCGWPSTIALRCGWPSNHCSSLWLTLHKCSSLWMTFKPLFIGPLWLIRGFSFICTLSRGFLSAHWLCFKPTCAKIRIKHFELLQHCALCNFVLFEDPSPKSCRGFTDENILLYIMFSSLLHAWFPQLLLLETPFY